MTIVRPAELLAGHHLPDNHVVAVAGDHVSTINHNVESVYCLTRLALEEVDAAATAHVVHMQGAVLATGDAVETVERHAAAHHRIRVLLLPVDLLLVVEFEAFVAIG